MNTKYKNGFTLIELLATIFIIGILSSFLVINLNGPKQQADLAGVKTKWAMNEGRYIEKLWGKWSLDEGSGLDAADSTDFKNKGTLSGFDNTTAGYGKTNTSGWLSSSDCISEACLKFDGADDKITTTSKNLVGAADFTVSAWIKRGAMDTTDYIAGSWAPSTNSSGLEFYIANNKLSAFIGVQVISNGTVNTDWHYVVATRSSGVVNLYIDGNKDGSGTLAGSITAVNPFTIGNGYDYSTEAFIGIIDEVSLYSTAITLSQIQTNYIAGLDKLFSKNIITKDIYNQRLAELESNLAKK